MKCVAQAEIGHLPLNSALAYAGVTLGSSSSNLRLSRGRICEGEAALAMRSGILLLVCHVPGLKRSRPVAASISLTTP
jgi:hypothetical protein